MSIYDLPLAFREAIALHSIIEVFGIPTADIFVAYCERPGDSGAHLFQVVARQGDLEFRVDVGDLRLSKDEFRAEWKAAVREYNAATHAERVALTESTQARENAVMIIAAMVVKGFRRPEKRVEVGGES